MSLDKLAARRGAQGLLLLEAREQLLVPVQLGAQDLSYSVELSNDLGIWESGLAVLVSSTSHGDGTATEVWRAPSPSTAVPHLFMRLKVEG